MEALQRINTGIELLEAGYIVEWTSSRVTESGARTMSYPNYDKRLMEALWGASELVGTDYGYTERVEEVRDLSVPGMTRPQLSTFLTWVQRGERFCDGFIDGFVEDGRVLQALRRAAELERGVGLGVDRAPGRGASGREQEDQRGRAVTPENTTTEARIRSRVVRADGVSGTGTSAPCSRREPAMLRPRPSRAQSWSRAGREPCGNAMRTRASRRRCTCRSPGIGARGRAARPAKSSQTSMQQTPWGRPGRQRSTRAARG